MKNKLTIFIIFFFIFSLTSRSASTNEFTFETEEIKIFENGNLTKAYNGVATSVLNNFFITAEEFEYNNKKSLLKAFDGVATYSDKNIKIKANNFDYYENEFLIKAYGNVEVEDLTNNIIIKSQSIIFNIKNEIISSKEKAEIRDNLGNLFLSENFIYKIKNQLIKINNGFLTDVQNNKYKISKAFINLNSNKLIGKDITINFNNSQFQKNNEPRLKGNSIISDDNTTTVSKGVFTTCKKNDDCPPWEFSAEEIKHDKDKQIINYKNAWLKIYDKKVFYFPKFFHPDPSVKRQSGFLMPTFEDSSSNGLSLLTPYYLVVAENKDFTFNPRFYSSDKLLLQTEYRQVEKKSQFIADFSSMQEKNESSKSHLFSKLRSDIELSNFDESEISLELQQTSNDTYLKTHKLKSPLIENSSLLVSNLGISAYSDNLAFNINTTVYEDLSKPKSDRYEFLYPSYNILKDFDSLRNINGNISLNSNGFIKKYDTNIYEAVAVNDLIFNSDPKYTKKGFKNTFNILLKNINTDSRKSENYKDTSDFKLATVFQKNISYPMKKETKNDKNIFKPKISLKYSPNKNKNLRYQDSRIDVNNIFALNRIGLNDTVEGGASITYGLDYSKTNKKEEEALGLRIANILRLEKDENLPKNSSLGQKTSDIVGDLNFSFNKNLKIKYDFSIDENLTDTNHQLLETQISINNFITKFEYLNQNNTSSLETYLSNRTSYIIDDSKKFTFETRENKKTKLTEFYNLIYEYRNDCLVAAIAYNKDYYNDGDLKPEENIFLKLTIMPFGEATSPNLKK